MYAAWFDHEGSSRNGKVKVCKISFAIVTAYLCDTCIVGAVDFNIEVSIHRGYKSQGIVARRIQATDIGACDRLGVVGDEACTGSRNQSWSLNHHTQWIEDAVVAIQRNTDGRGATPWRKSKIEILGRKILDVELHPVFRSRIEQGAGTCSGLNEQCRTVSRVWHHLGGTFSRDLDGWQPDHRNGQERNKKQGRDAISELVKKSIHTDFNTITYKHSSAPSFQEGKH